MDGRIALIGFGEAGETFARAAAWNGSAAAYDILPKRRAAMRGAEVIACGSLGEALQGAGLVLSLVTADAALPVAREAAAALAPGALFCDMNSVAPQTKRRAAEAIEKAQAHYLDVAIMAPVEPVRLQVPLLAAGPTADRAVEALAEAGFARVRSVGSEVGRASAIKMVRSVMVKGIEALTAEMIAAADAAGVVDEVLASLDGSERGWGWPKRAAYNLDRMKLHGARRAAEMEEVARTLEELGVEPIMTNGTILRQCEAGTGKLQEQPA